MAVTPNLSDLEVAPDMPERIHDNLVIIKQIEAKVAFIRIIAKQDSGFSATEVKKIRARENKSRAAAALVLSWILSAS